jgi:putative ABC transport system substrate-binding protein
MAFSGVDPVRAGFVASLARPGGNVTGLTILATDMAVKRLEVLKQALPKAGRVAVVVNPRNKSTIDQLAALRASAPALGVQMLPKVSRVALLRNPANPASAPQLREAEAAARALEVRLHTLEAQVPQEIDSAFAAMTTERAGALVVLTDSIFTNQRRQIAELAAERRLPALYGNTEHAEAGGLMAYGANFLDLERRAATYVDRILKGARPADLPVEQPSKFELIINLKTAKALGLTIPPSLLQRADQVIE